MKQKFLSLSRASQHKKCADKLRELYESCLMLEEWMGLTPESLSHHYHAHMLLAGKSLKEHNLLSSCKKTDRDRGSPPLPIAIYLDNIRSAHNVGSIIRTTECLSLGTIYFSAKTATKEHKQVRDAAMGTEKHVTCIYDTPVKDLPSPLIALELTEDAIPLKKFLFPPCFTLILGNEEFGCSEESLKLADHKVYIPMFGRKNSLNVANAFAITAYEIRRQLSNG